MIDKKKIFKLLLLTVFIGIGIFLITSCYESHPLSNEHTYSCRSIFNTYDDFFVVLPIFVPSILIIFSSFCKVPFKVYVRIFLILLFLCSLFCSFGLLFLGGLKFINDGYKLNYPIYFLIQIWDIGNTFWLLLLCIPFKERFPLIHWPFDNRTA